MFRAGGHYFKCNKYDDTKNYIELNSTYFVSNEEAVIIALYWVLDLGGARVVKEGIQQLTFLTVVLVYEPQKILLALFYVSKFDSIQ